MLEAVSALYSFLSSFRFSFDHSSAVDPGEDTESHGEIDITGSTAIDNALLFADFTKT